MRIPLTWDESLEKGTTSSFIKNKRNIAYKNRGWELCSGKPINGVPKAGFSSVTLTIRQNLRNNFAH
ncbi:hypothetical protein HMPREF0793_0346 [Staphylococcus caprae M23864:W1]|nr:hypothetical protein HMPREF0793_0346 [Staphylococcus caprae M23864:W1]